MHLVFDVFVLDFCLSVHLLNESLTFIIFPIAKIDEAFGFAAIDLFLPVDLITEQVCF